MTSMPPQNQPYPMPGPVLRRRTGYGYSPLATLIWAGANLALILVLLGPPASARTLGAVIGSLVIAAFLAAVGTWLVARTRATPWPFRQLVLLALPFFLVLRVVLAAVAR